MPVGRKNFIARREGIDAAAGYRNGYGRPRRLSLSVGTITLRRPRVRTANVSERPFTTVHETTPLDGIGMNPRG